MPNIFLKKIEKELKNEKLQIEKELKKIAKKSKEGWDVVFPVFNGGESGSGILEKGADEVEEYSTLLQIKPNLEAKLKEINLALKKIKKKKYGICEKCQKEIERKRLEIYPETRFCTNCKKG